MASFHQNGQFLRRAKFWLSAATHNLFFLSILYHLIVLQGWVLFSKWFPRWKMAAAFKSVANNQTQISVLRLTSKSSWVWFAIARIKNCNQTFGNEAEKQLCFSFLKSFMVQLSSCIIVAKKVSYCMIGQARSFAPVVLCLSLHCCVRSSLRDWSGAGQEDQTFLSLEQMLSLWKWNEFTTAS